MVKGLNRLAVLALVVLRLAGLLQFCRVALFELVEDVAKRALRRGGFELFLFARIFLVKGRDRSGHMGISTFIVPYALRGFVPVSHGAGPALRLALLTASSGSGFVS